MADKADVLQGTLDLVILKTLALGPLHGYAIGRHVNQTSRALIQIPQGSLYPALHRLENRGWIDAEWVDSDTGRRAKVYRLTRSGRSQLEREIADWQKLSQAIRWVLQS